MTRQAQRGDTVQIHYTGSLEDGTVFDSSQGNDPIAFTIGAGEVIPGFEEAVVGMSIGDTKRQTIESENAYGEHRDELMFNVSRDQVPPDTEVSIGDLLQVGLADGQTATVMVAEIDDEKLVLDANHPLAGKTLIFDLELVGIE